MRFRLRRDTPPPPPAPPGWVTAHLIDPAAPFGRRYRSVRVEWDRPGRPRRIDFDGRTWALDATHYDPPAYEPA